MPRSPVSGRGAKKHTTGTTPPRPLLRLGAGSRRATVGKATRGSGGRDRSCPPRPRAGGSAPAAFPPSAAGPCGRREPAGRPGRGGRAPARHYERLLRKWGGRREGTGRGTGINHTNSITGIAAGREKLRRASKAGDYPCPRELP